jgi:hypothetical protein
MCMHGNQSRPFTRLVPNPKSGQPVLDSDGSQTVVDDMVLCHDETMSETYVRCLSCGYQCLYVIGQGCYGRWHHEEYIHIPNATFVPPDLELAYA